MPAGVDEALDEVSAEQDLLTRNDNGNHAPTDAGLFGGRTLGHPLYEQPTVGLEIESECSSP